MLKKGTRLQMKPGYLRRFFLPRGEFQKNRLVIGPDYPGRSAASGKVSLIRSSHESVVPYACFILPGATPKAQP